MTHPDTNDELKETKKLYVVQRLYRELDAEIFGKTTPIQLSSMGDSVIGCLLVYEDEAKALKDADGSNLLIVEVNP